MASLSQVKSLLAYERIRDMILTGEKLPGARLVIADLADELDIGHGPIREAIMRLDRTGLVRNEPYKGAVVAYPPRLREIELIYEMRIVLEKEMALEAIKHFKEEDFRKLEEIHEQLSTMNLVNDTFFSLDWKFHTVIFEASKLAHLAHIVHKMLDFTSAFLNLHRYEESDCTRFNQHHEVMIKALREKDAEALTEAIEENLLGGLALVKGAYSTIVNRAIEY